MRLYTSSKSDYIDIDDNGEYEDMVGKIFEKKPKKVTISVEMTGVKKGCRKAQVHTMPLLLFLTDEFISQNDSDNSDSDKGHAEDEVRPTST